MRILHLIDTMSPEAGGPSEAVRMLVEFAPPGVASEIITSDPASSSFLANLPCPVHALGPANPPFYYNADMLAWLRANRSRFDGVLVHGLWSNACFAAHRTLRGHTPYVVFAHGMLDPYFKRAFPLKHAKKWIFWLASQYWTLRSAARVLFTTTSERDLAAQSFWLHSWKPLVVPLGAEAAPPPSVEAREAFYALCPAVRGRRFLLFLGRIHLKKGVDLLVEAFLRCAHLDPALDLVVAGPDPAGLATALIAQAARAGLADRIHWPGMVSGIAKAGAFDACEAFILPSHQENFGIAVVEALAAARPVLLSDKINIAPEIAEDRCGLIETDTVDGAAALIERWLALPAEEKSVMSSRALATFEARYNMRRNTEAILRVFETATEAS